MLQWLKTHIKHLHPVFILHCNNKSINNAINAQVQIVIEMSSGYQNIQCSPLICIPQGIANDLV